MSNVIVITIVNAPHRRKIDAHTLVECLLNPDTARSMPGHMSSFFGEVPVLMQLEFAKSYGIAECQVVAARRKFAEFSGEAYPL